MPKVIHDGLKKRCDCPARTWSKCPHPWQFSFHHAGREHRWSLDVVARDRNESMPRSRAEAATWRDRLRNEIRAGKAVVAAQPGANAGRTVEEVARLYRQRHIERPGRRAAGQRLMTWYLTGALNATLPADPGQARVRFGDKQVADVTTDDIEAIRDEWRRRDTGTQEGRIGADRLLKRLRHFFNWAIEKGYADQTPFRRHGVALVHFAKEKGRTRRLQAGEEASLLTHASSFLHALIVAALETGMRKGELLQLRWRDVHWEHDVLLLPAAITKTDTARDVPMTQRLKAVLEMRKHAPDGSEQPKSAFVFGNEVGEPTKDIRDEWLQTCKRAGIDGLHFHDLRREFASRMRETPGVTDHHVRDWLGHADLATTSRYLSTTRAGLQQARRAFEQRSAESFAHHSHTRGGSRSPRQPESTMETGANWLNSLMVRKRGLEPPLPCGNKLLRLLDVSWAHA
jgi:integrase